MRWGKHKLKRPRVAGETASPLDPQQQRAMSARVASTSNAHEPGTLPALLQTWGLGEGEIRSFITQTQCESVSGLAAVKKAAITKALGRQPQQRISNLFRDIRTFVEEQCKTVLVTNRCSTDLSAKVASAGNERSGEGI